MESAIASKNEISMKYFKKDFTLKPLKIALFEVFWYLLALDNDKFKKFYFKGVKSVDILEQKFSVDEQLLSKIQRAKSAWFDPSGSFIIRLWIDKVAKNTSSESHCQISA
ncbi:MAG: WYL domain-containing protein [Campylobacter sp.]|nr:WYL domain-containing protein [Campylobacter sp.]MDY4013529.1 WYL domain-containing protein [Campylobacter sp.]